MQAGWMHWKLFLVVLLWLYTLVCGKYVADFKRDNNKHSERFFRIFNELPAAVLITVVILVIVKPF
jgi:putative membrane protein